MADPDTTTPVPSLKRGPKKDTPLICVTCKAPFLATRHEAKIGRKYCSNPCRHRGKSLQMAGEGSPFWQGGKKIPVRCLFCNSEFLSFASRVAEGKGRYCSKNCHNSDLSNRNSRSGNPSWSGGKVVVSCRECGAAFGAGKAQLRSGKAKFCSKKCKGAHQKCKVSITCDSCKRSFDRHPSEIEKSTKRKSSGTYCSRKCRAESQKGELNPAWLGGAGDRPNRIRASKEMRRWRVSVFERDGYTCQLCGDKPQDDNQVKLNAHHLKSFTTYPELRFELSNGQTLCVPCHRKVHSKRGRKKHDETNMSESD